jgi:Cu(I)/Ag(I) efflux system periplasmic protein CusF
MTKPIAIVALMIAFASAAWASTHLISGTVTKIDADAQKLTIRHGPIKKFEMDGMTMVFRVKDPAMLKEMKAGDNIQFDADKVDGSFTVIEIQKSK